LEICCRKECLKELEKIQIAVSPETQREGEKAEEPFPAAEKAGVPGFAESLNIIGITEQEEAAGKEKTTVNIW
jgi:hypothetical protein